MYKKVSMCKIVSIISTIICFTTAILFVGLYIASSEWFYMVMCLLMIVNGLIMIINVRKANKTLKETIK